MNVSPLATQHPHRQADIVRREAVFGLLVHTTGGGILTRARKTGKTPLDVALAYYHGSQNGSNGYMFGGPGYVLGHWGELHQIAPDDVRTHHAGHNHRDEYLSGRWTSMCSLDTVARWRAQWPGKKSPQHLFPSSSPNMDYVGLEMVPLGPGYGPPPMAKGLRFSREQHDQVIELARDLAQRHDWPKGWNRTPRLLGHEDVCIVRNPPYGRSNSGGGWDPGFLRAEPYFDFTYVRTALD